MNNSNYLIKLMNDRKFLSTHNHIRNFSDSIADLQWNDINDIKFSSITQKNLKLVSQMLNIDWKYCISYYGHAFSFRKGFFIYGISSINEIINYHRKETKNKGSGQTFIHIKNKNLQVTKLLRKNQLLTREDFDNMIKLNDVVDSLKLQKIVFEKI